MNSLAEWKIGECYFPAETGSKPGAISFKVSPGLTERRIYLYVSAKRGDNTQAYRLDCEVVLLKSGTPMATLPATVANHSGNQPNKSTITAFLSGGNPVEDSIGVTIANPFGIDPNTVVLQPMRVSAQIDQIDLNMNSYTGGSPVGWRAILVCISTLD